MTRRIPELDILRAVAIILIVFSHFPLLTTVSIPPVVKMWCATIGLAMFIFISGIVLQRSTKLEKRHDIIKFYKKRILRIYPLYLIVVGVYVVIQYLLPTTANKLGIYLMPIEIIGNALGLQAVFNIPSYGVLWFVGLILIFYFVYPLIMFKNNNYLIFGASIAIFGCILILHLTLSLFIPQVVLYFPVFLAGVLLSANWDRIPSLYIKRLGTRSRFAYKGTGNAFPKLLFFISGISYAIYLTHLLILTSITFIPATNAQVDLLLIFAGIPAIIAMSYLLTRFDTAASRKSYYKWIAAGLLVALIVVAALPQGNDSVVIVANNSTMQNNTTVTPTPVKHKYILYYISMAAECREGVKMNSEVTLWASTRSNVEFHKVPQESDIGIKYDSRISPTVVLLDKTTGKVLGRWVGIFNMSELTALYKP